MASKLKFVVEAEVKKALKELGMVEKEVDQMKKSTSKAGVSMKQMKGAFTATAAKFAAGVGAILAVKSALEGVTEAYRVQEEAEKALSSAIERNPLLDEGANERIKEFASSL